MKFRIIRLLSFIGSLTSIIHASPVQAPYSVMDHHALSDDTIRSTMRTTAEYQLQLYGDKIPKQNWLVGTLFSSFVAASEVTGDSWYLNQALNWSRNSNWDIKNPLHADDVCPGQTYLDLYFIKKDPEMFASLEQKLSPLLDRKEIKPGELHDWDQKSKPLTGRNLWGWCDALYMAPPVYARMAAATGEKRYLSQMHALYWDAVDFLYDPKEKLFYRNSKAETEKLKSPNGKKVFWGRGNGWVIGGLARMIEYIPKEDPMRDKYLKLFNDLSFSLARYQQEDGLWRAAVNDPEWYPGKETTGSAFFVYAMAKGINEGWLPREYFLPIVMKGWSGLMTCVSPEGRLGYSQLVAGAPGVARPEDTADYAAGEFILAGCEMLKLKPEDELRTQAQRAFQQKLVANDGAWTCYNDEQVIYHDRRFIASYVKPDGHTALSFFGELDVPSVYARTEMVLSTWTQKDDHNNAALLPLKDGRILATYTKDSTDNAFFQRKIDLPKWDYPTQQEERKFDLIEEKSGLTYQNLYRLSGEKDRIYTFFRGINFNPTLSYSDDEAETWSKPIHLLVSGTKGNQRPYVKYVSDGKDRIDLLYTDGHPRDSKQNNVYHIYYRKGAFHDSNGKVLRTLENLTGNPIKVEEGTLVFDGGTSHGRGWVWDLEYDQQGRPYGAFISSPNGDIGTDMRYWTARFDGEAWGTEEIAYAGSNLYSEEQHYAGGIALDPFDDQRVVISADVHPKTGEPLPERIYQLFKGTRSEEGWTWQQLTHDPVHHHLRPVLVRGKRDALFWFAGEYRWFGDYKASIRASLGL